MCTPATGVFVGLGMPGKQTIKALTHGVDLGVLGQFIMNDKC